MQLQGYYLVGIIEMWWDDCMTAVEEQMALLELGDWTR